MKKVIQLAVSIFIIFVSCKPKAEIDSTLQNSESKDSNALIDEFTVEGSHCIFPGDGKTIIKGLEKVKSDIKDRDSLIGETENLLERATNEIKELEELWKKGSQIEQPAESGEQTENLPITTQNKLNNGPHTDAINCLALEEEERVRQEEFLQETTERLKEAGTNAADYHAIARAEAEKLGGKILIRKKDKNTVTDEVRTVEIVRVNPISYSKISWSPKVTGKPKSMLNNVNKADKFWKINKETFTGFITFSFTVQGKDTSFTLPAHEARVLLTEMFRTNDINFTGSGISLMNEAIAYYQRKETQKKAEMYHYKTDSKNKEPMTFDELINLFENANSTNFFFGTHDLPTMISDLAYYFHHLGNGEKGRDLKLEKLVNNLGREFKVIFQKDVSNPGQDELLKQSVAQIKSEYKLIMEKFLTRLRKIAATLKTHFKNPKYQFSQSYKFIKDQDLSWQDTQWEREAEGNLFHTQAVLDKISGIIFRETKLALEGKGYKEFIRKKYAADEKTKKILSWNPPFDAEQRKKLEELTKSYFSPKLSPHLDRLRQVAPLGIMLNLLRAQMIKEELEPHFKEF